MLTFRQCIVYSEKRKLFLLKLQLYHSKSVLSYEDKIKET